MFPTRVLKDWLLILYAWTTWPPVWMPLYWRVPLATLNVILSVSYPRFKGLAFDPVCMDQLAPSMDAFILESAISWYRTCIKGSKGILVLVQRLNVVPWFSLQVRVKMTLVDNFCHKIFYMITYEPHHEKTNIFHMQKTKAQISCGVTAQSISAFVFATRIVQFLFFLNPKFQA